MAKLRAVECREFIKAVVEKAEEMKVPVAIAIVNAIVIVDYGLIHTCVFYNACAELGLARNLRQSRCRFGGSGYIPLRRIKSSLRRCQGTGCVLYGLR